MCECPEKIWKLIQRVCGRRRRSKRRKNKRGRGWRSIASGSVVGCVFVLLTAGGGYSFFLSVSALCVCAVRLQSKK